MKESFRPVPLLAVDLETDTLFNDDVDRPGSGHVTLCPNREARPEKFQPRECLVAGLGATVYPGQNRLEPCRRVKEHQIELVIAEEFHVQRGLNAGECVIGTQAPDGLQDRVDRGNFEQMCLLDSATPVDESAGDRSSRVLVGFHAKVQAGSLQA